MATNPTRPETVEVDLAAHCLDLQILPSCRDGVIANLRLLAGHARLLEAYISAGGTPEQ